MPVANARQPNGEIPKPSVPWDTGLLMALICVACFSTAIGFDTSIYSSFDLSKLAILYVVAVVLVVGFLTKCLSTGEVQFARTPLDAPIVATIVAAALSAMFSADRYCSVFGAYKTYEGLVQILIFVMFYYAACRLRRSEVVVVVAMILVTGVAASAYGLLQRLDHDPLRWSISIKGRVISNFGNPVFFATYMVMAVPLGIGLLFRDSSGSDNRDGSQGLGDLIAWLLAIGAACYFCAQIYPDLQRSRGASTCSTGARVMVLMACSAGLCICLGWRQLSRGAASAWPAALGWVAMAMGLVCNASFYCTRTRGAFVGLVAGGFFFPLHAVITWADRQHNVVKWAACGLLVAGLNMGLNLWPETSVVERLAKVLVKVEQPPGASPSRSDPEKPKRKLIGSAYKRMLLYHTAADIIKTYPWLGTGPDAIERVVAEHWARDYQLGNGRLVEVRGFENRIHNEILDVWASQGTLGLFARVWLWLALLKLLWVGARWLSPEERPVLSGLGAAWVAYVVQNVMAFPTIPISIAVWSLMGCTVAWVQNDGESDAWPTRRWRFSEGAQALAGMAALGAAFLVLLGFILFCLVRPYRADRSFMRAINSEVRKQRKDAVALFGQAVELCPRSHIYRERLNQALLKAARATKGGESLAFLEQCVQSSEEMIRVSPWRASGYMTCGSALAAVGELLATKGKRDADKRKGIECLQRAETYLRKAVAVNPHNRSLRGALIDFDTRRQRWDAAADLLVETYRYWPKDERTPLVIYGVVQQYLNKRQYREAEQFLISAYDVVQDKDRAGFSKALATVYRLRGKNAQAVRVSREALAALDREEASLTKLLAPLLERGDDGTDIPWGTIAKTAKDEPESRAGRLARQLLRARAQRPETHYQLASSLAVMDKLKEAAAECRTALAQSPRHEQAVKLLEAIRQRLSSKSPPAEPAAAKGSP